MTLNTQQEEKVSKAFGALADSAPLGVEFEDLATFDEIATLPPQVSSRSPRRWLVAVAGAFGVLLLGLLTVVTRQTDLDTTAEPTLTPGQDSSAEWSRVSPDEDVLGGDGTQWIESVAAGGPGFVAVGWDEQGEYWNTAALWTSVDGVDWFRVSPDGDPFDGGHVNDVTAGGPGLVAVGTGEPYSDTDGAAVWTSVDGVSWARVPYDPILAEGGEMISVTAGGPGLVAVGSDQTDAVVWTSLDGLAWSRVPHNEAVFGGTANSTMLSVTVGGPGLVAVGEASPDGNRDARTSSIGVAAVWTSPDGLTWTRVPHDDSIFGGNGALSMESVTAGRNALVAVGRDTRGAGIWHSPDGSTWRRIPEDAATSEGAMLGVVATKTGYVTVGWAGGGAAIWESPDGIAWARIPHVESVFGGDGIQRINDLAVGTSGLVAVGSDGFPEDGDAAIWTSDG